MSQSDDTWRRRLPGFVFPVAAIAATLIATNACREQVSRRSDLPATTVLRMGVAQASPTDPIRGLRQLVQILSVESLLRPGEDGRAQPLLADRWTSPDEGTSVRLHVRPGVKFNDGTPLNVASIVAILPDAL